MVLFKRQLFSIATSGLGCLQLARGYAIGAGYAIGSPILHDLQRVFYKERDPAPFAKPWGAQQLAPKSFEEWIQEQRALSFGYLLDNVAPNGTNTKDAIAGTVIASPSRDKPDYYYQWVRDSAITIGNVVDEFQRTKDLTLKAAIDSYANLQGVLQNTFNPSGGYTTGGLGEPKFLVDGAPFTDHWGRPQRDGPPLRALTLMKYIRGLNETHPKLLDKGWLRKMYDGKMPTQSVIKADLEYVARSWDLPGFDLWEEINDKHFFTAIVQHRALVEGRDFAAALGDTAAADWYETQQNALKETLLKKFWNEKKGHIMSMLNTPERGGLDAAILLGSLHGGQIDVFPAWSDSILASLHKLVADMATRHPVNSLESPASPGGEPIGVGIGRYPEDVYDGVGFTMGNPWFLCTSTVSSVLYKAISHFVLQGYFDINDTNICFFNSLHPSGSAVPGHYTNGTPEFMAYLKAMFQYADRFLAVIRQHATNDGRLSEQFHSEDGSQQGARDLTWSYGSFIGAVDDRTTARKALID
ncbi:Six-hairpin glycosidase-like protein [Geopyxis carbonaria]|nr:Six-hairpin glycosidase-like protein [Geopyxis carbonaria]